MESESPNDSGDAGGRVVDDKTAEARERIERIEKSAGLASADSQEAAREVEDRLPEREAAEQPASVDEKQFERSLADLKAASGDLKERIVEEKKRNEMPIDSALGNPETERQNADGRNDLPDTDDD